MSLACAREPAEGTVVPLVSLTRPCSRPLGSPPPHQLPAVPARGRRPAPPPSLSQLPSTAVFAIFGHSAPAGGGAGLTSPREGGGHCLEEGRRAGTWGRQESCFAKSGAARAPHALGPCCSEGGLRKGFGGNGLRTLLGGVVEHRSPSPASPLTACGSVRSWGRLSTSSIWARLGSQSLCALTFLFQELGLRS